MSQEKSLEEQLAEQVEITRRVKKSRDEWRDRSLRLEKETQELRQSKAIESQKPDLNMDHRKSRSERANKPGQGRAILQCSSCGLVKPIHQYNPDLCDVCYSRQHMRKIRKRVKEQAIEALKEHTARTGEFPAPWVDIAGMTNQARPGAKKRKLREKIEKEEDVLTYDDRRVLDEIRELREDEPWPE